MSDDGIVERLRGLLGPERVLNARAVLRAYELDGYPLERREPQCVVLPESTEEVRQVVQICREAEVPCTPRGAGTGLSGGATAVNSGVIVSTKRLTQILALNPVDRWMHAQSGVVNRRLSMVAEPHGLHFAPDPSSQTVSTLGGNIAENSGGPHTLKYGVTVQHVLQVRMVTPEADVVTLGSLIEGGPGPDLLSLIVGGEGTLGIVTEAWVRLTPNPPAVRTALASFPTIRGATESVAELIERGAIPAALEIMDHGILAAVQAAFGLSFPAHALALLLMEFDGEADVVDRELAEGIAVCQSRGAIAVEVAQDERERQRLWSARKKAIGAMGRVAPSIVTHDGVIPRSKLPEMLEFCAEVAGRHGLALANLFHAGDGNLHPCIAFDDRDPAQVAAVHRAGEEILRRCVELGGSVSGEHGIGVEKADLMRLMFDDADLRLQADAKRIFNEGSLCNPCKILPNQKGCLEHRMQWRGAAS